MIERKRNARTDGTGFGNVIADFLATDESLMIDVEDLINGRISWDEIPDILGVDVETGNAIPDGKLEA